MRNLNLEAAIWSLFASPEFFLEAARECDNTSEWFGNLAISRKSVNLGRNNQVFDTLKSLARDFNRGAELAKLGDYQLVWDTARSVRGDIRGMMEQPLQSWMNAVEYKEFSDSRIERISTYARQISTALHNAMVGAKYFCDAGANWSGRNNDDDGFPGDEIVASYEECAKSYSSSSIWRLPHILPECQVDTSISCQTGDEVPSTGVWYPKTGLERHSLTFAIKGVRMQPVFRVTKTRDELEAEGVEFPYPETVAVATVWHPVIPSLSQLGTTQELWAKAGQPCPKAGVWQPTDPGAAQRTYQEGEPMLDLKSAYGFTVWRWVADR